MTSRRSWSYYLQLVGAEQAFKSPNDELGIRPIFHQREAHIFFAFLAYCLQVTLKQRLQALAPGLTPRSVFEKFAAVQMIDMHVPTTDVREIVLTRYTEPEPDLRPTPAHSARPAATQNQHRRRPCSSPSVVPTFRSPDQLNQCFGRLAPAESAKLA